MEKRDFEKYLPAPFTVKPSRKKKISDGILVTQLATWGPGRWATAWVVINENKVIRGGIKWGAGSLAGLGKTARLGIEREVHKMFEKLVSAFE